MSHHIVTLFIILESLSFGLTGGIFYLLPLWSRRTIFFSVTVQPDFRDSPEGLRISSQYKTAVLTHCLIGLALFLTGLRFYPLWGFMAGLLWQIVGFSYAHHQARVRALPHAVRPSTLRTASLENDRVHLAGGWPVQAGPFAIVLGSYAYLWDHWSQIPSRYPIHWNLEGAANGWAYKRTTLGVEGLVVAAAMLSGLLFLNYFIAQHTRQVHATGVGGKYEEEHRRSNLACLTISGYLLAVICSLVNLESLHPTSDGAVLTSITTVFLVLVALALIIWKRTTVPEPTEEELADARGNPIGDRTEDRYWRWGFYVNPNDAALMVEKRFGIGYTFNMAHPKAWVLLTGIVGVVLLWPVMLLVHHH